MHVDEAKIFEEALSLDDPRDREDYLNRVCSEDMSLKYRVIALLDSFSNSSFLDATSDQVKSMIKEVGSGVLVGAMVGPYKVLELIGEGGMGEVYLAEHLDNEKLRTVAVKVIKPELGSRQVLSRFHLEQRALECLDHPNIARYLGSGTTDSGSPYFAMEWANGLPITEYCDRFGLTIHERLRLFLELCSAVKHAHEHGIIHRDLKPSNLLVVRHDATATLKVIDFGIAKVVMPHTDLKLPHTRIRQWLGTPNYMSPEQMQWSPDVDFRTDIYSMGVILFELLTGYPPKQFDSIGHLTSDRWRLLLEDEAPKPSQILSKLDSDSQSKVCRDRGTDISTLLRLVRHDLDGIVLKAIHKSRSMRYSSAGSIADDVLAVLDHRRPLARSPGIARQFKIWSQQNSKTIRGVLNTFLIVAAIAATWVYWRSWRFADQEHKDFLSVQETLHSEHRHEHFLHDIKEANSLIHSGNSRDARQRLLKWHAPGSDYRDSVSLGFLNNLCIEPIRELRGHQHTLLDMDISPDGRWIVSCDKGGEIVLWENSTGKEIRRMHTSDAEVTRVRFSPDSTRFASAGTDRIIRLWDVDGKKTPSEMIGHERTINGLDWSPDGQSIVAGDRDGVVNIWDVNTKSVIKSLERHSGPVRVAVWSPDGRFLATSDENACVNVWSTSDWKRCGRIDSNGRGTLAIAFSPDNRFMMFGGYGGGLFLVDLTDMSIKQEIAVKSEVSAIAIIDQNNVIVGGIEGAMETYIKVQDDWEMVRAETLSRGWIRSIRTSLSKWQVSVASESDRTIREYALESFLGFRASATYPIPVEPVQQSKLVLSRAALDLDVGIRRVDSSEIEFTLPDPVVENCSHYYSATRDWLFVGTERLRASSRKYSVDVYHCNNWELIGRLQFPGEIRDISLTSDSTYLIGTGWNGQTRVWDLETMKARDLLEGKGLYEAYACATRNGLVVVGAGGTNRLTCLRTGTWDQLREVQTESNWGTIQFAPRSDWLVVGETNRVSVWASDLSSCLWSVRFSSNKQPQKIAAMAISPDEQTLVAYCFDGTLRFWDTKSRTELIDYQLPRIPVFNIRFLDSQTLRMATSEGSYLLKAN